MSVPIQSSRLYKDYKKLHKLEPLLFYDPQSTINWADDIDLIDKFVSDLEQIPNIRYIHFLGGETLYLKSFYTICNKLIEKNLAKDISLGTTTNCTIYTPELEHIIENFKHVHLGLSIESLHLINDYVRWPSQINSVRDTIDKFISLRKKTNLHLALRITPNLFTISHIDTIFEFMLDNSIIAESCNILQDPSCLRIELLPKNLIQNALDKINTVIEKHQIVKPLIININRRNENIKNLVINDIIYEYKILLENLQLPVDIEKERANTIKFIKAYESIRNNKILDYLPEYEEFLRSYGY